MSFLAHPLLAVRAACLWAPRAPAAPAAAAPEPIVRIAPLELPHELQRRVAAAAASEGKSPHAFMLEAIEMHTRFAESRRDFVASVHAAEQRAMRYARAPHDEAVLRPALDHLTPTAVHDPCGYCTI